MIKGLCITPPILGRIAIGKVVEKNGKRLPEKDDQFTITSQIQNKNGWVQHPLDEQLREGQPHRKLRSIPVRLLFNDPDLNLRAEYCLFDRTNGRPMCVGNGDSCRRYTASGMQTLSCPSPDGCELAKGGLCKPYGRLHVQLGEPEELGSFIFRTTGYNSIRTLTARLHYYKAVSGGLLASMPLLLRIRGKSTTQSRRTPIYYVDLTVRDGVTLEQSIADAKATHSQRLNAGYEQEALDEVARQGFSNGTFEESEEDGLSVVDEFYCTTAENSNEDKNLEQGKQSKQSLMGRLENIAQRDAAVSTNSI